jgi:hypothetical protein
MHIDERSKFRQGTQAVDTSPSKLITRQYTEVPNHFELIFRAYLGELQAHRDNPLRAILVLWFPTYAQNMSTKLTAHIGMFPRYTSFILYYCLFFSSR